MKKYISILVIVLFAASVAVEAQRRPGEKSTRSASSIRTSKSSGSSKAKVAVKKSTPANRKAVQARPLVRSSAPVVRSAPRSSSSTKSTAAVRSSTRSNFSQPDRPTASRQYSDREAVRKSPAPAARNYTQPRSPDQKSVDVRPRHNPGRVEPGTPHIYRSTRIYVRERPIRYHYRIAPHPRDYRARYYPYRPPVHVHFYWSFNVYRHWCSLYPVLTYRDYYPDYSIGTISAYDALFHIGEIRRVYGEVSEVFYAAETDEYFLYIGAFYPYHDFTVVIPGEIARSFSRHPDFYFEDEHIEVTGLITEYDDKPEIVVREKKQLKRY